MLKQGDYVETVAEPRVIARFDGWHNSLARTNRGLWSKGMFRPWSPRVGERVVFWCKNDPTEIEGTISTLGASGMGNEAFGFGISGLRPASNHPIEFMRPAPDAPKEAKRFYMTQPSVLPKTLPAGTKTTGGSSAITELAYESRRTKNGGAGVGYWGEWSTYPGEQLFNEPDHIDWTTVPLAPPQPLGDGDRLFESGCCLCGATHWTPSGRSLETLSSSYRANPGMKFCKACGGDYEDGWVRADKEITRRKQLAEKPATASPLVDVTKYRAEKPRYPHTGFVPYAERVGLQSLSAPKPDDGPAYVNANWPEDSEYWGQG